MTPLPEPAHEQAREFVATRFGETAAATLHPAGAGEWSRAFSFRTDTGGASGAAAGAELGGAGDDGAGGPGGAAGGSVDDGAGDARHDDAPRDVVIRFGRHVTDFAKDRLMGELVRSGRVEAGVVSPGRSESMERRIGVIDREPRRGNGSTVLPVPRVIEIGDTPWGYFVVAERCFGTYLDALDGDEMRAVLPDLLRTLDRIAALDPPGTGYGPWNETGVAPYGRWRAALLTVADEQARTTGWRSLLDTRPGPAAVFARGLIALDESLAGLEHGWPDRAGPRRIVHADLLNRNVLVRPGVRSGPSEDGSVARGDGEVSDPGFGRRGARSNSVTAVLDWGNAWYGDPLYDVAWLLFWWPWYPAWSGIDIRGVIERHLAAADRRPPDLDARLRTYQLHIGLDSLTYQALTRRWANLDRVADQVDALLSG